MAQTVNAIILGALKSLNVKAAGESLSADEAADGLIAFNDVIELMNLQPLMHPSQAQLSQALTTAGTYTFGTGGDNSVRPVSINFAFVRDSSNLDIPVNIISNEKYSLTALKATSSSYPFNLYYRNTYPLGVVNLYPTPSTGYTLYLETQAALSTYSAVTDSVDLAPAYIKYIKNQLAIDISPEYKANISPVIYENKKEAKAWIKRMNSKDKPIMQNTARQATSRGLGGSYLFGGV